MAALRPRDFDMPRRRVDINRAVTEANGLVWGNPKDHERRSVPFPVALIDDLEALMAHKGRDDLVFTNSRGGLLRVSNYRPRYFAVAVAACQKDDPTFPTITPHDLRHTAASLAVSAGANVLGVQRMLEHAKASMTLDVYSDLFDSDLDAVAGALDVAIQLSRENPADKLRTKPLLPCIIHTPNFRQLSNRCAVALHLLAHAPEADVEADPYEAEPL
ncbi:tyrosine-type recombinase/integrase [Nocardia sp. 348MFTsu5.1]|uniref:tyrosine-type recombinase/integrase n=1 Tax=Nocardia sp. 348MFTsu5.1 TaxID=1172185 RepID=UPI00039DA7D2|nr:tyrosine-type recombinase/integrase [Nocardia sp. 348MFTsu5.1]